MKPHSACLGPAQRYPEVSRNPASQRRGPARAPASGTRLGTDCEPVPRTGPVPPRAAHLPTSPCRLASPPLPHAAPRAAQAACEHVSSGPARQRPPAPAMRPGGSQGGCFQTPAERLATQHCPQHARVHTHTFQHTPPPLAGLGTQHCPQHARAHTHSSTHRHLWLVWGD